MASKDLSCNLYPIEVENYKLSIGLDHPESEYMCILIHNKDTLENVEFLFPLKTWEHMLHHMLEDTKLVRENHGSQT